MSTAGSDPQLTLVVADGKSDGSLDEVRDLAALYGVKVRSCMSFSLQQEILNKSRSLSQVDEGDTLKETHSPKSEWFPYPSGRRGHVERDTEFKGSGSLIQVDSRGHVRRGTCVLSRGRGR